MKFGDNVALYSTHKVAEVECTLLHFVKRFLPSCISVQKVTHTSNKTLSVFKQSL
jgi:hypothetical protein